MKGSGINTLIELLNEYEEELSEKRIADIVDMAEIFPCYWNDKTIKFGLNKVRIISKKYGFIQRLLDNDKIVRWKIEERISGDVSLYLDNREYYGRYKWLLMLLAIQDEPIEFLISILK